MAGGPLAARAEGPANPGHAAFMPAPRRGAAGRFGPKAANSAVGLPRFPPGTLACPVQSPPHCGVRAFQAGRLEDHRTMYASLAIQPPSQLPGFAAPAESAGDGAGFSDALRRATAWPAGPGLAGLAFAASPGLRSNASGGDLAAPPAGLAPDPLAFSQALEGGAMALPPEPALATEGLSLAPRDEPAQSEAALPEVTLADPLTAQPLLEPSLPAMPPPPVVFPVGAAPIATPDASANPTMAPAASMPGREDPPGPSPQSPATETPPMPAGGIVPPSAGQLPATPAALAVPAPALSSGAPTRPSTTQAGPGFAEQGGPANAATPVLPEREQPIEATPTPGQLLAAAATQSQPSPHGGAALSRLPQRQADKAGETTPHVHPDPALSLDGPAPIAIAAVAPAAAIIPRERGHGLTQPGTQPGAGLEPGMVAGPGMIEQSAAAALSGLPAEPQRDVPRPAAMPPARQVLPIAIAMLVSPGGNNTLSVTLEPLELGRLEIRVGRDADGASLRLIAERPETLSLLARDQRDLQQGLAQSGISLNAEGIRFEMAGQGGQPRQEQQPRPRGRQPGPETPAPAQPMALPASLLDMQI